MLRRLRRAKTVATTPTDPDLRQRVAALAELRGESETAVLERFGTDRLRRAPTAYSQHLPATFTAPIVATGDEGEMTYAELPDGKRLYGYPSMRNHRNAYELVADLLPDTVTEDTLLVAIDATVRVVTDFAWPVPELMPPSGGTVVELGAYVGHKTMRFADAVGADGRVLAVEMMPANVSVLRRNIEFNGYSTVDVMNVGVWDRPGERVVMGKGLQQNSLVDIGMENTRESTARVERLDDILDGWGRDPVDLCFMTINGAEIEVLESLDRWLGRIRAFFIAAPYSRPDGRSHADLCRDILERRGLRVLPSQPGELRKVLAVDDRVTGSTR